MDRIIEEIMFINPPDDHNRALLLDHKGAEGGDEAEDMGQVAAYLRNRVGCKECLRINGGARALAEAHRFLFGLTTDSTRPIWPNLPSQLSSRLFCGSTADALDPKVLEGLGITHVVSVLRRQLKLEHVAEGQHLLLHVGAVTSEGTDGVRSLLDRALPTLLDVLEGADETRKVLVHCEEGAASGATAVACAALVADGSTETTLDQALALITERRPKAAMKLATLAQLRAVEAWLIEGAPPSEDATGPGGLHAERVEQNAPLPPAKADSPPLASRKPPKAALLEGTPEDLVDDDDVDFAG